MLEAFVRLVERRSFTAVSKELSVKQSTISKWMAALEDELGVTLIARSTRAQHVTESGRQFYEHARGVLASYEEALAQTRAHAQARPDEVEFRGRVRISVPVVFGRLFVLPAITKFVRKHPQLEMQVVFSDRYVSLVDEGFDLSVRVGTPADSSLRSHPLGRSSRCLVASKRYLATAGPPRTPKALTDHQCLVHTEAPTLWTFTKDGRTQRVSVRGRISANNSEATLAMTKGGLGISLLASWLVSADLRAGRLVQLLKAYSTPPAPICALTPSRRIAPRVRALIEHLRASLAAAL